jgi:hypothetical protein
VWHCARPRPRQLPLRDAHKDAPKNATNRARTGDLSRVAMHQPVRSCCARLQRLTNPDSAGRFAAAGGSPAIGYTPRRPHGSSLVVEEPSGADQDDVIDLVGPPPASPDPEPGQT